MITQDLLDLLACPKCEDRPPLELDGDRLVCTKCRSWYKIVDGVPHLLPEDANSPEATSS